MKRIINSSRPSKQVIVLTLVVTAVAVTFLWPSTKATAATSATISGQVFNDKNGNGVKEAPPPPAPPGDTGLQGWTVQLIDTNNQVLASQTTDANGNYSITLPPVPAGSVTIKVREVVQAGWGQTTSNPADIVVTSTGGTFSGRDFGDFQKISISGQVFNDLAGNGARDAGDAALPGRTIFLDTTGNGAFDNGEPFTTTDVSGNYSFTNLGPGTYKVREVIAAGWIQTTANPADITATSGTNVDGTTNAPLNFGNFLRATISGKVFDDTNGNGVLDAGEPGLSGWPITLDTNGDHLAGSGEPLLFTDAQGNYIFSNLGPGTYGLLFGFQSGWRPTQNFQTAVTSSGSNTTVNGGFFKNAVISGTVYVDQNGNGVRDAGEPGQGNWTVRLLGTNDQSLGLAITAADGSYSVFPQGPGTVRIREVAPSGWVQTTTLPADIPITTSGTSKIGVDFGNFLTATISGKVFDDTNANTALDPGEPGLPAFTVYLDRNANGVLDAGERITSTDASGNYHFDLTGTQSLNNGTTALQVQSPSGWSASYHVALITIVSGSNIVMNLGQFKIGSVNGTVFNDRNGNGVRDAGESGLGGSTVQLINIVNQVVASQITAADGSYTLPIQTRGTYRVREVVPAGFTQTTTNPADIVATSGISQSGVDFGITQPAVIQFSQANYTVTERGGSIQITVNRAGEISGATSVDFATDDGSIPTIATPCSTVSGKASERCDYTRSAGTLSFAPGETQKSFIVLVNDDSYAEGAETLQLVLSNPGAGVLGQQSTATLQITDDSPESSGNPLDDPSFFIRGHYHDFLNREPDQSGLDFWTGNITSCGSDDDCRNVHRIHDSAAFFLSIEFQETGYLVERLYKVAYGDATGNSNFATPHTLPVPVVRLREFLRDTQEIGQGVVVGAAGWEQLLETNKQAFSAGFVSRQRFTNAFPLALNAQQFVTQLDQNAGQVLTDADKTQLMGIFGGPLASSNDPAKRALVLRRVADSSLLQQREFNRAFVLMQFFGYLRRNPDDAQDTDHSGFDFWLTKLNQFNGDFVQAEMVKAFITSAEYHQRFGP